VVGVLTQPDRPRGRGRKVSPSPVKELALTHGLPVSQPASLRSDADRHELASWQCDVLVVVAYGLLLPPAVLTLPALGCVNIHPSLLPRWRGAAPIQRAVLAGDAETCVSIMLVDAGLDTGPVLLQRATPLGPEETAGALHDRLASLGAQALLTALEGLGQHTLVPRPQATTGVTYAAKIDKSEALIDWTRPAEDIARQIRAFNPIPVAETRAQAEQLRIFAARVEPGSQAAPPGTVLEVAADSVLVQCGHDRLALLAVQRPGRRVVGAGELARSLPLVGQRLG